ncbi:type III-A CRISPR-associated RAMP protein Csm4 [Paraflavitalea speifideaquila]|uniref:type III-A CRISPR-associated RAMP protein Csm4 n=1 Tax=Paraflavitalea speifideaquila TaxID=3076558 RepID=UPI0028E94884|nr:type III-A CRISPR-associated RAMP protein Csm4 [Paraflavitalea speifideiaquila]
MEAVILKTSSGARFHFGTFSNNDNALNRCAEIIHSDIIFGALIQAINSISPQSLHTIKEQFEKGNIKISSAFYCIANQSTGKYVYLLPKPMSQDLALSDDFKKLRKVKYISKGVWEKGIGAADWFNQSGNCHSPDGNFVVLKTELDQLTPFRLSALQDSQKVQVRTKQETGNLYTQTDLVLLGNQENKIYWYFLLEENNCLPECSQLLRKAIEVMSQRGIGGERSTGCGKIDAVEYRTFSLAIDHTGDQYASISLTIPASKELGRLQLYKVITRGGMHLGPAKRLPVIHAIGEGAVQSAPLSGAIVDCSIPGYPSWRYGCNVSLPLHINHCTTTNPGL